MMTAFRTACTLLAMVVVLCACPAGNNAGSRSTGAAAGAGKPGSEDATPGGNGSKPGGAAASADGQALAGNSQLQAPKQFVLIYSGDTDARLLPSGSAEYDNLTGGLPALAAEITAVQQEIIQYNRMRVANEGGDPSQVRVDNDAGMIGDSPFMLLDYGGWVNADLLERPYNTTLMLEAFSVLPYSLAALRDWQLLSGEEQQLIAGMQPRPLMVCSVGEQPELEGLERIHTRDAQALQWGVFVLPSLAETERSEYDRRISVLIDEINAELEISGVDQSILLASNQTAPVYQRLLEDNLFDVVIGAPGTLSVSNGFGEIPADKPLMLPHLEPAGSQLARCHLIWDNDSATPVNYFFERRQVKDSGDEHLPFRNRVRELTAPAQ